MGLKPVTPSCASLAFEVLNGLCNMERSPCIHTQHLAAGDTFAFRENIYRTSPGDTSTLTSCLSRVAQVAASSCAKPCCARPHGNGSFMRRPIPTIRANLTGEAESDRLDNAMSAQLQVEPPTWILSEQALRINLSDPKLRTSSVDLLRS